MVPIALGILYLFLAVVVAASLVRFQVVDPDPPEGGLIPDSAFLALAGLFWPLIVLLMGFSLVGSWAWRLGYWWWDRWDDKRIEKEIEKDQEERKRKEADGVRDTD